MLPESVADVPAAQAPQKSSRTLPSAWLGAAVVALAFLLAAALTWRKWGDPLVDFGMQLYVPWKVSQGFVLNQDIVYMAGGPFSQYFNALLFRIFGVSFLTIVFANLLIAGGLIALMYRRFLKATDVFTATMICLAVALVFAFGQYSDIGNYNYITPYCHETWHGLVLSIAAVALMSSWMTKQKLAFALCAGFCGGLVFLAKPDIFVAFAAMVLAGLVWAVLLKRKTAFILKSLAAFLSAAALSPVIFLVYFHLHMGTWGESLRAVCFAWVPLLEGHISQAPFYKWCTGMDAPWLNARMMLIHFIVVCGALVASGLILRRDLSKSFNRMLAVGWIALLIGLASAFNWVECGRSLPLFTGALLVMLCAEFWKTGNLSIVFPLLWSTFALVLLTKMGLYSRIWHYGFALAMPASAAVIYFFLWLLPRRLESWRVDLKWFRWTIAVVLITGMSRLFVQSQFIYYAKTVAVGSGADQFFASDEKTSPAGAAVQSALDWLDHNAPKDATLAVLPQGAMINYLSRRPNPGHYQCWDGSTMSMWSLQPKMTADFEATPPDYIILAHRDEAEHGMNYFGKDERFGLELMRWIRKSYEPVKLIGSEPLVDSHFGIKILRRAPAMASR